MKKHLAILLGHFLLATLHYYLMLHKGVNGFQFISFTLIHAIWHGMMRQIFCIYGLK